MKKSLKIIGVSIVVLILFRGTIFRLAIKYVETGSRQEIKITNSQLIEKINRHSENREIDIHEILEIADRLTKEELKFTFNNASANSNELINTKQANCVGYSAMFNSIVNYLIRENNLQSEIKANHKIGQLELFGINLHQFFESSFFTDHDFNEIIVEKASDQIFIDPSVSDYLWIKRVAKKE